MSEVPRVHQTVQSSLDAATHCAYESEHCADACLGMMPDYASLCRDCAQMCWTTASFINRGSRFISQIVKSCIGICEACGKECEHHQHKHCQSCAEAYRQAVDKYRRVAQVAAAV